MPNREKLADVTAWCQNHIPGDEKGEAQIFLEPVTAPGVPKNYLDRKKLVTEDCIKPT